MSCWTTSRTPAEDAGTIPKNAYTMWPGTRRTSKLGLRCGCAGARAELTREGIRSSLPVRTARSGCSTSPWRCASPYACGSASLIVVAGRARPRVARAHGRDHVCRLEQYAEGHVCHGLVGPERANRAYLSLTRTASAVRLTGIVEHCPRHVLPDHPRPRCPDLRGRLPPVHAVPARHVRRGRPRALL